jgi:hypothetical protein
MEMAKKERALVLAGAAALFLAAPAGSRAQGPSATPGHGAWLHVRVDEGAREAKVSVNLPIAVVDAALQAAPETVASGGRIQLGHWGHHEGRDLSISDLRRAWSELKNAGDTEFVTVEEEDQKVRISRAGDLVLVHVDKPGGRDEVRVEVPIDVVDALLSGQGDELNVRAAFTQLQKRRGDIVRVRDDKSTVRIWIDEGN